MSEASRYLPGLYVAATPIGNLGDITLRALELLKTASCIACEDTRMTRDLLRFLNIEAPTLVSVREHNERAAADSVIARIAAGAVVAYVSDAGTPAISDPGARLVAAVREAGFPIFPIPGVSAVTTALSVAGLESTAFTFDGFAPVTAGDLADFVAAIAGRTATTVFFESPHRIEKTLRALATGLPVDRRVVIARELTKKFETVSAMDASGLAQWIECNAGRQRGEFVLVVAGTARSERSAAGAQLEGRALLKLLLEELPPAKAAKIAAKITGETRESLYATAEILRAGSK